VQSQRIVLLSLIGVNLAAFIGQFFIEAHQTGFVAEYLGISDRAVRDAYAWQFVTAIFLHNGPWYLLFNLVGLYFLGLDLESILGQRHFLYLYLAGAVGGELGHLFLMPSDTVLLAASGSVAALLAAYATILPEMELRALLFFIWPVRVKVKHVAYGVVGLGVALVCLSRTGVVGHSALLGGCATGWLYAHLLGFGRPSWLQRFIKQRRARAERLEHLSVEELMAEEIDPLLEKIARKGFRSLTRRERRRLAKARQKILEKRSAPAAV
jgi:membrane associated rhomboid family serine protease